MTDWLILGCGYTGRRLAAALVGAGDRVIATRRSTEAADLLASEVGCDARVLDVADSAALEGMIAPGAVVVDSVPPTPGQRGQKRALIDACAAARASRVVYLSSTGVYPEAEGRWVTEDEPAVPHGDRGRARLAAETELLAAARERGVSAVSLRIAGIYGPGRGVLARLRAGTYRVIGAGDTFVSRIHVDDLVAAIIAVGTAGELRHDVFNVADDDPTTSREHADGIAAMLGRPPPPAIAADQVSATARAMLGANRRIANGRLKAELGLTLRYPSWREGVRQCLAESATD